MILHEILDSLTDYQVVKSTSDVFKVTAQIGERKITFIAELVDEGVPHWDVLFIEKKGDEIPTSRLTGSGKELQVFSFVKRAFQDFVDEYQPELVQFSSAKEDKSRTQLYRRMLKRYMPKGYSIKVTTHGDDFVDSDIFTLIRD